MGRACCIYGATAFAAECKAALDVYFGDNLEIIRGFPNAAFDLVYIDPPFNTGKIQSRTQIQTVRDDQGDRMGFQGRRYRTIRIGGRPFPTPTMTT